MRFYIVDDNIAVIKVLENIIRTRELGQTIGTSTDPEQAVREIIHLQPEIVLVDLLMSGIDGVTLVTEVKKQAPEIAGARCRPPRTGTRAGAKPRTKPSARNADPSA